MYNTEASTAVDDVHRGRQQLEYTRRTITSRQKQQQHGLCCVAFAASPILRRRNRRQHTHSLRMSEGQKKQQNMASLLLVPT